MQVRWVALLVVLALPWRAEAARQKDAGTLAELNLFSPPSLLGIAGLLTRRATTAATSAGYAVLGPDDAEQKVGREALKKMAQCDLKPACIAALAGALGTKRLLVGSLDRDEVHYLVKLELIELGTGQPVASAERSVLIASRQLDAQFDAMLPDLLAGKSVAPTRLTLTSPQKHVRVQVDDRPLGELPVTLELSPGRHEVKADKANYLGVDRFVDLEPGQTASIELPLTLLPNHYDPDEPIAAPTVHTGAPAAAVASQAEPAHAGGVPVASWVALGVGVAAAGAGTYFGLAESSISKRAIDANHDGVLDITRAEALDAHRDAALANVSFAVAGASVLTGVILYLADDGGSDDAKPAAPAKVGFAPLPGRGATASVTLGF